MAVVQAGCYQRWYAGDVCDSQAETGSYEDVCFRSATVWPGGHRMGARSARGTWRINRRTCATRIGTTSWTSTMTSSPALLPRRGISHPEHAVCRHKLYYCSLDSLFAVTDNDELLQRPIPRASGIRRRRPHPARHGTRPALGDSTCSCPSKSASHNRVDHSECRSG